ncbi:MAG: hypothetical protein HUU55_00615 [Myxococcales bacterium]|nr:hypothetical protein [Myxococcales bacterium]
MKADVSHGGCSTCVARPSVRCAGCSRNFCDTHGGPAWVARHLFGSRLIPQPETLCGLCQSHRIWQTWRFFVVLLALAGGLAAALEGQPWAPAALIPIAGVWWWVATTRLRAIERERGTSTRLPTDLDEEK